jgi:hypothetical protein
LRSVFRNLFLGPVAPGGSPHLAVAPDVPRTWPLRLARIWPLRLTVPRIWPLRLACSVSFGKKLGMSRSSTKAKNEKMKHLTTRNESGLCGNADVTRATVAATVLKVLRDVWEQPVLDLVPFRCARRIVVDVHRAAEAEVPGHAHGDRGSVAFGVDTPRIGAIPAGLPALVIPELTFEQVTLVVSVAVQLALLGAIDTLLSALLADSLTKSHHDSNRELIGQGIGNMGAALVGGLPGAGANIRTIVNIEAGGRTRLSAVTHGLFLLAVLLGLHQFKYAQTLRRTFRRILVELPEQLRNTPEVEMLAKESDETVYNIVHLIYHSKSYEGISKDYEFSRRTMEENWTSGYDDAVRTLDHPEVFERPTNMEGVRVFDFAKRLRELRRRQDRHRRSRSKGG